MRRLYEFVPTLRLMDEKIQRSNISGQCPFKDIQERFSEKCKVALRRLLVKNLFTVQVPPAPTLTYCAINDGQVSQL
jgi:hypothetical protein